MKSPPALTLPSGDGHLGWGQALRSYALPTLTRAPSYRTSPVFAPGPRPSATPAPNQEQSEWGGAVSIGGVQRGGDGRLHVLETWSLGRASLDLKQIISAGHGERRHISQPNENKHLDKKSQDRKYGPSAAPAVNR